MKTVSRKAVTISDAERDAMSQSRHLTTVDRLDALISAHERGDPFSVEWLELTQDDTKLFTRLRRDPPHFSPAIFSGNWAVRGRHPQSGELRIVRILTAVDGVSRVIGRQGKYLYAWPGLSRDGFTRPTSGGDEAASVGGPAT